MNSDVEEKIKIQEMLQDLEKVIKNMTDTIRNFSLNHELLEDIEGLNIPFYDRVSAEKRFTIIKNILYSN